MKRVRTPFQLSDSLHHQLNTYALTAAAAGMGMLALAPPAEAKIIYTKADEDVFGFFVPLDLTHDGTTDFFFMSYILVTTPVSAHGLFVGGALRSNGIQGTSAVSNVAAAALRAGVQVGPKGRFISGTGGMLMGSIDRNTVNGKLYYLGPWENGGKGVKNRYLGLRFQIKGKTHYGWARLNFPDPQAATLTGYAYETVPNKPIIAGKTKGPDVIVLQPASLGHLAQGSAGLAAWRQK